MTQQKHPFLATFSNTDAEAVLLALNDEALIHYVQVGKIAGPVEAGLYRPLLTALGACAQSRAKTDSTEIEIIPFPGEEPSWLAAFEAARNTLKANLDAMDSGFNALNDDRFRWKMATLGPARKSILDLGPSDGVELLYLRSLSPKAELHAIDFLDRVPPERRRATGATITEAAFEAELPQRRGQYDLVFSNHVLEHSHDPDKTLRLIHDSLIPGGTIAAALPVEGLVNGGATARALGSSAPAHPLDLHAIAPAHAWKTTPNDLAATLSGAGFSHVRVHYNPDRPATLGNLSLAQLAKRNALGRRLNALSFGAARRVLKLIPGSKIPRAVARAFASVERRIWFGEPTLTQAVTPEVLVTAWRPE